MEQQWDFFKQGETSGGVFYPKHYIVAGYADLARAQAAEDAFRRDRVPAEDVCAASGDTVAQRLESRADRNVLDKLGSKLTDFLGTGNEFVAQDKVHAGKGGAFLFLFAPTDDDVAHARLVFERHAPVFARRYLRLAIEEIVPHTDDVHTIRGSDTPPR
jgi:hypothetical protein